jgi:hypothetical protein
MEAESPQPSRFAGSLPDLLVFGLVLVLARLLDWQATDLVWSLWLSSLVIGYAMILWTIFRPLVAFALEARRNGMPAGVQALVDSAVVLGGLFAGGFMTLHFWGFHYVHSQFLNFFFPIVKAHGALGTAAYLTVLKRYWVFLPMAAVAERAAFRLPSAPPAPSPGAPRPAPKPQSPGITQAYGNVMRMHMLIFFFAFAHWIRLDSFTIYAAVYSVYFFPWRALFGSRNKT